MNSTIKEKLLATKIVIDNEYLDKYVSLIESNLETKRTKFVTQRHHIIPRYYYNVNNLEVDNSKDNLVNLSYKCHFLAHLYLSKCSSSEKFSYNNLVALHYMTKKVDFNCDWEEVDLDLLQEAYEKAKKYASKYNSMYDEKIREKHLSSVRDTRVREKISNTLKEKYARGELFSEEHKAKISLAQTRLMYVNKDGVYKRIHKEELEKYLNEGWVRGGRPLTEEHQRAIINSHLGKKYSDELRKKLSEAHKGLMTEELKQSLRERYLGTKWMNNGIIQKQVKPEEFDKYQKEGFSFGTLKKGR